MVLSIEVPPFPPAKQQVTLAKHWDKCLETWVVALQYCRVTLLDNENQNQSESVNGISKFLGSFLSNVNEKDVQDALSDLSDLAQEVFLIIERIINLGEMRSSISEIERRLGLESFRNTSSASALDDHVLWRFIDLFWRRFPERMEAILKMLPEDEFSNYIRDTMVTFLAAANSSYTFDSIKNQETAFTFCLLANNGCLADKVVNSSWLRRTLPSLYNALCTTVTENLLSMLVRLTYISITCLAECLTRHEHDKSFAMRFQGFADDISFLIDQSTDLKNANMSDFMNRLLWLTPLLSNLEIYNDDKLQGIAISLQLCRNRLPTFNKPKTTSKALRQSVRETGKAENENEDVDEDEDELNKGIYIDQLIDLFPHLSEQTASELLSKFEDSVERATSFVLDNPEVISRPQDGIERNNNTDLTSRDEAPEFDLNKGRLHRGKATLHGGSSKRSSNERLDKQKILDALALIYDAEDDERDDTYDDLEVGNIPVILDDEEEDEKNNRVGSRRRETIDPVEMALWNIYKKDPQALSRSQRASKNRQALKQHLKESLHMERTDEQIEGWARMLDRDPRRKHLLESETLFSGNPNRPQRSAEAKAENQESSDSQISRNPPQQVKAPQKSKQDGGTQPQEKGNQSKTQQRRKEQNKSRHANHNRKAQRDKKMSRGGIRE